MDRTLVMCSIRPAILSKSPASSDFAFRLSVPYDNMVHPDKQAHDH